MKFGTLLRVSPAAWVAPFALALPLLYYVGPGHPPPAETYGYAPTITSYPLRFAYPFTYAVVSALAAWASGALKQAHVWEGAYLRSRYHIAARALFPVLLLGWLMLILPAAVALIGKRVWPTWDSVSPLAAGLVVCVAHAVIGFLAGRFVPRVFAAPILAVVTWVAVAFTVTADAPWVRHVSGAFPEQLDFGEAPLWAAIWPHVAFTGAIAAGLLLAWAPVCQRAVAVATGSAVALAGLFGTYEMVKDYDYTPPLRNYAVTMRCDHVGTTRVCMPEATAHLLPEADKAVTRVLGDLRARGVSRSPQRVVDTLPEGRYATEPTETVWRVPLTMAIEREDGAFAVTVAATGMHCVRPDPLLRRVVTAWAAHVTGTTASWEKLRRSIDRQGVPGDADGELERVLAMPKSEQAAWFADASQKACRGQ
ncbi:hypothetical protein [Streptomyces sp. NPDC058308]|uniref:hypothetical protein n=1 Tax=Streptomyces sp. NPDC058308 TaxID=3346440 RepID=UPI0036EED9A8